MFKNSIPKANLDPITLSSKISIFGDEYKRIPFSKFRGIRNQTPNLKPGNYCFAISLFQLMFHCKEVVRYLKRKEHDNNTDELLSNIVKRLNSTRKSATTNISDFILGWDQWYTNNGHLQNQKEDIKEFCQYLLFSCSQSVNSYFKIDLDYINDPEFDVSYYLQLSLNAANVQSLINNFLNNEIQQINILPKYLFLSINRTDGFNFLDNSVQINSFIQIENSFYKFSGASIFLGDLKGGHYVTLFKFYEKFVLFDCNYVYNLFFYPNCSIDTYNIIQEYDLKLRKNSVLLLYTKYNKNVTAQQLLNYEKILTQNDEFAFLSLMANNNIQTQFKNTNYNNLMTNTLNIISNKSITQSSKKKMALKSKTHAKKVTSNPNEEQSTDNEINSYGSSGSDYSSNNSINKINSDDSYDDSNETSLNSESENSKNNLINDTNSDESYNNSNNKSSSSETENTIRSFLNVTGQTTSDENGYFDNSSTSWFSNSDNEFSSNDRNEHDLKNESESFEIYTNSDTCEKSSDMETSSDIIIDESAQDTNDNDLKGIKEYNHLLLPKQTVDIDGLHINNLSGKLFCNNENIVKNIDQRENPSKFAKYRKLFKLAGKFFRQLNFSDQGRTNAQILQNKLNINPKDCREIEKQGTKTYKILKRIIQKENYNYSIIEESLDPILEWYKRNYITDQYKIQYDEILIDDNLSKSLLSYNPVPLYEKFTSPQEFEEALDAIEYDEKDSDIDEEFEWTSTDDMDDQSEEEEEEEYMMQNDKEFEDITEDLLPKGYNATQSHTAGAIMALFQDILKYQKYVEESGGCETFDMDDNQTVTKCYYWQERYEIFNAKEIINQIKLKVEQKTEIQQKLTFSISDIKRFIERDFLKLFNHIGINANYTAFVESYIRINNDPETMYENVKLYKKIKKMNIHKSIYSKKTLLNKISNFVKLSKEKQEKLLTSDVMDEHQTGFRIENQKVTNETIKCLITLVLDFPTLSAVSYAAYLNSPFGTNEDNPISPRTVSRYLKALNFSVNKASFAPPNRNSIGLRIYRVAWSKFIEKIIKNDNILLGFIDEAAVTACEGRKYGRSYIGLTPLANCPLSKIKCSVIALVIPAFGVFFKFAEGAVDNLQYSEFLKESVHVIRQYLCNNKTEIVFIEDNCPVHNTQCVEDTIEALKIALLPIVQYSPSLNEVVEGYFGFIKSHNICLTDEAPAKTVLNDIKNMWKDSSNNHFSIQIAQSLYYQWRIRMKLCKKGNPIYSGHIDSQGKYDVDFNHLQYVTVDRISES